MRQEHLELLCCPLSLEPLSLEVDERADDGHVVTGALRSSRARYPIDAGVPRFILSEHSHDESTTVEAFGKQWDDAGGFSWTYGQDEDYFEQYFHPLPPASFRDRSVLDAGCGNGRLVEFALRYQPGVVVGLDYSRSVDIAFRRTRTAPNVLIVQGSLLALPLAHQQFHVIFSLGVIHHLSSPAEGVERLAELLEWHGKMHLWTYSREGNELYLAFARPLRRFSRLSPPSFVRVLSLICAVFGWPYVCLCAFMFRLFPAKQFLPMDAYLAFLYTLGFSVFALVIHDQLAPAIAHYPSRSELLRWCENAGVELTHLDMRTGNSWRVGLVRKPAS